MPSDSPNHRDRDRDRGHDATTVGVRRGLAAVLMFGFLGAAGCALILGIDDKPVADAVDAAVAPLFVDKCQHIVPPLPPPGAAPGADDNESDKWFVATRSLNVTGDDAGTLGFDLDGKCSCGPTSGAPDGAPSCTTGNKDVDSDGGACDADGGIDNAFLTIPLAGVITSGSGLKNEDIDCGRTTVLVVITAYNGRANDPQVEVSLVLSPGLQRPHTDGEAPSSCNDGGLAVVYAPRWDGTDVWSSDTRFVINNGTTPNYAIRGWVNNWMLVAKADPGIVLSLPFGPVVFDAHQLTVVAELQPLDNNGQPLDPTDAGTKAALLRVARGQFTGRAQGQAVLKAVSSVNIRDIGYVCPDTLPYNTLKSSVCGNLDVASDQKLDFTGVECDSITAAARFVAEPAQMANAKAPVPDPVSPCAPTPDNVCADAGP